MCKHVTTFHIFTPFVIHRDKIAKSSIRGMNFNTCMSCVAMITTLPLLAVHTHLESLRLCQSLPQNGSATAPQQESGEKKRAVSCCLHLRQLHICLPKNPELPGKSCVPGSWPYHDISVLSTHTYHQEGRNCNSVPGWREQPSLHYCISLSGCRPLIIVARLQHFSFSDTSVFDRSHLCPTNANTFPATAQYSLSFFSRSTAHWL